MTRSGETSKSVGTEGLDFGKYILLRRLASGGMGEIFLARRRESRELLVIKRILSHHLDKPEYLKMFYSEAQLVRSLNHQNIIQIYEVGEFEGNHYIAMEYVRGRSLREIIDQLRAQGQGMPIDYALRIAIQLCEGLHYAHAAQDASGRPMGIIHRDINPQNVLVSYDGSLKIIDFGIAKSEMTSVQTATGTIKGKFVYMSPEQSAAEDIDQRSDLFSLGIVLYELLTLENPFARQNVVLSLEAIQQREISILSELRPDGSAFDHILVKALKKKPAARYQTASDMAGDLSHQLGNIAPESGRSLAAFLTQLFVTEIGAEEVLLAQHGLGEGGGSEITASITRPLPKAMPLDGFEWAHPQTSGLPSERRYAVQPAAITTPIYGPPLAVSSDANRSAHWMFYAAVFIGVVFAVFLGTRWFLEGAQPWSLLGTGFAGEQSVQVPVGLVTDSKGRPNCLDGQRGLEGERDCWDPRSTGTSTKVKR